MPVFLGVTNSVLQWVLTKESFAVKTRYPSVPRPNVQLTAEKSRIQVDVKVRHILIGRNAFKGCER